MIQGGEPLVIIIYRFLISIDDPFNYSVGPSLPRERLKLSIHTETHDLVMNENKSAEYAARAAVPSDGGGPPLDHLVFLGTGSWSVGGPGGFPCRRQHIDHQPDVCAGWIEVIIVRPIPSWGCRRTIQKEPPAPVNCDEDKHSGLEPTKLSSFPADGCAVVIQAAGR